MSRLDTVLMLAKRAVDEPFEPHILARAKAWGTSPKHENVMERFNQGQVAEGWDPHRVYRRLRKERAIMGWPKRGKAFAVGTPPSYQQETSALRDRLAELWKPSTEISTMSQAMPPAAPAAIPQVPAAPALNPAVVKGAEGLEAAKAGLLKRLASRLPKSRGGRAALGTAAIAGSTAGYLGLKKMFSGKPGAQASAAPATAPAAAPSAGRKVCPHVEAPVTEHLPGAEPTDEIGYYASSLSLQERDDAAIGAIIRGHWSAIENGTHYRRDVTLGEDACRTAHRSGAAVLASLRNLTNGLYELERERERTKVDTLKSWCQQQTFSTAWPLLNR